MFSWCQVLGAWCLVLRRRCGSRVRRDLNIDALVESVRHDSTMAPSTGT